MKTFLLLFTVLLSITIFSSAKEPSLKIAKVDYSEIDDLLETIVFLRPENKELGTRHQTREKQQSELQEKMQKAIFSGEKINPMEAASGMMDSSSDRKEIKVLTEKLILEIIEQILPDQYQVILKDDYRSSLIYTKIPIDDITVLIKQELLKRIPKEK